MITVEDKPSILVSYAYRESWEAARHLGLWREVVIDSGAFTARSQGITIELAAFADWVLAEKARDPLVTEVFTLDVIGGDWRETERNTRELWRRGVEAIPVYHVGEPTDVLKAYARDYPKVALGGSVGYSKKIVWAALCFREVWPAKIHGLGFGPTALEKLPFHTVDHSSWSVQPHRFGSFGSFGGAHLGRPPAGQYPIPTEVAHQLKLEADARRRWRGKIPAEWGSAPSIRLVAASATCVHFAALGPPGSSLIKIP